MFCSSRFEYIEYTSFLLGKDSAEIALQGVFLFLKIVKWRLTADLDLIGLQLLKRTTILKNLQASVLTDHRQIINLLNNMFGKSWIFSKYQQKVFWWNGLKQNACFGTKWITLALKDQFLIDPNIFCYAIAGDKHLKSVCFIYGWWGKNVPVACCSLIKTINWNTFTNYITTDDCAECTELTSWSKST